MSINGTENENMKDLDDRAKKILNEESDSIYGDIFGVKFTLTIEPEYIKNMLNDGQDKDVIVDHFYHTFKPTIKQWLNDVVDNVNGNINDE